MRKLIAVLLTTLIISGCSAIQFNESDNLRLPVSYATLKVIERDNNISAEDILDSTSSLRSMISEDRTISVDVKEEFLEYINIESLPVSDQFLILNVLDTIEVTVKREVSTGDLVSEDVNLRLSTLIDYVEQAARMY